MLYLKVLHDKVFIYDNVLIIEENYLTWHLSWEFTYTLRPAILLNMCKKFY